MIESPPSTFREMVHEVLAVVELGPVSATTVAVAVGYDETTVRRLLHEQVERRRMKASAGPVRYELTAEGALDLAKERLIYAIVAEFMTDQAASIAGLDDDLAGAFGLTRRDLSEAATAALTERWIAPVGPTGAYLAITRTGERAWAAAAARWPRFLAPAFERARHLTVADTSRR